MGRPKGTWELDTSGAIGKSTDGIDEYTAFLPTQSKNCGGIKLSPQSIVDTCLNIDKYEKNKALSM